MPIVRKPDGAQADWKSYPFKAAGGALPGKALARPRNGDRDQLLQESQITCHYYEQLAQNATVYKGLHWRRQCSQGN
jgi:hypothetical protein